MRNQRSNDLWLLISSLLVISPQIEARTFKSLPVLVSISASSPNGGTPTPLTIVGKTIVGKIVATSGQIIENVHVTTTSGSCIVIDNVKNVIIRNSEIGPCGQAGDPNTQGVEIRNSSDITIQQNVIHNVSSGVYVVRVDKHREAW